MKTSENSSPPSTAGLPNLIEDQSEVADTWYLDPAEWEQMRAEVAFCYTIRERDYARWGQVYKGYGSLRSLRPTLRRSVTSLQTKARAMRALLQKPMAPDRILEFRRFVAEWRREAADIRTLVDRVTKQIQRIASPFQHPDLQELGKLRDEMRDITEVAARLHRREALLLKAIGAGLYMTTTDIHLLHQKGGLSNRQFMELLSLEIRVYEGRSGRKHA